MTTAPKVPKINLPGPGSPPGKLKDLGGSNVDEFNNALANNVVQCLWIGSSDQKDANRKMTAALAALMNSKPTSELEGMLIGQLIACHHAALECYRRAMIPEQPVEGRQQDLSFASKLSRTYAALLETLDKHRGKGQQTVRVEHVTVNAGGQAIVGSVNAGAGGAANSEGQSHANISNAPEPAMRSPFEAEREAVPQRCDEER